MSLLKGQKMMLYWFICLGVAAVGAISSQSLLDLFIILMAAGWLGVAFQEKGFQNKARLNWLGIEWAFVGYFIVVCLGFMINASREAPWGEELFKFTWVLHLYLFIFAFRQIRLEPVNLTKYFAWAFLAPTLYSFASYIHGTDLITGRENSRITGLVNSATYHAHGNAVIFVFFAAVLMLCWKRLSVRLRAFASLSLFLLGLSILLTFTRGIWLSIFVSTFIMLAIFNFKTAAKAFVLACVILGAAYMAWPKFSSRVDTLFLPNGGDPGRANLFKVNVQIWKEYPMLGIGYGENLRRNREYWDRPEWNLPQDYITSHAHNQILNVMSTTGLLGLFFFLSFWIFFLLKNWKLLRRTDREKDPFRYALLFGCMWAQVEFVLGAITDVSFEYAKIRALILLVWALLIALEVRPEIAAGKSSPS